MTRASTALTSLALLALLAGCASSSPTPADDRDDESAETSETTESTVANGYYPVAEGNVWVYTMTYPEPIGIVTETETMTSVVEDADGGATATITREFHYENGSYSDFSDEVTYLFNADGSIEVPYQTIPSGDTGAVVTVTGGSMVWPSDDEFEAGTVKTGEVTATVETGGQTFNQVITFEISGAGEEEVSVPFGDVTARKLVQALTVTITDFDITVAITATSWLQADVGLVRTEIPDVVDGAPIVVELVSFTPAD